MHTRWVRLYWDCQAGVVTDSTSVMVLLEDAIGDALRSLPDFVGLEVLITDGAFDGVVSG